MTTMKKGLIFVLLLPVAAVDSLSFFRLKDDELTLQALNQASELRKLQYNVQFS